MFDFSAILPSFPLLLEGIPLTLLIALAALVLGLAAALPIALIRAANVPVAAPIMRWIVEFFRTTPPLLHIVWVYYVLPQTLGIRLSAVTVVIVALTASTAAQLAEILRGGLLAIPRGQFEAASVLGINGWNRLRHVILPQVIRLVMAPSCNVVVSLVKDTSLASIIAVPELMNRGQIVAIQTFRPLEVLSMVAVLYFVLTYPVALVAGYLEGRSRAAYQRG
jgi:polar amino acid transport system permease protein